MDWLGIDIGGANLKLADGKGFADSRDFELWKTPHLLTQQLRTVISEAPSSDHLIVTMTGELADCFATKKSGVEYIVESVEAAADQRHTRIYSIDGKMTSTTVARRRWELVAASNWHALASFAGRYAPEGAALLIDIGSTTCDIIPLQDGIPTATGKNDTERLLEGELVYTGVERSPICGVASSVTYRGRKCPLAQELFATTHDVYLTLGQVPEEPTKVSPVDGRQLIKEVALDRLARSICSDRDSFKPSDAVDFSNSITEAQQRQITIASQQVISRLGEAPANVILSGHGEFLGRDVVRRLNLNSNIISLNERLGPEVSRCAPAHALAIMAREAAAGK